MDEEQTVTGHILMSSSGSSFWNGTLVTYVVEGVILTVEPYKISKRNIIAKKVDENVFKIPLLKSEILET